MVGVAASGSQAVKLELDALGVGCVAGCVLALHCGVLAHLVALVAIAPSELVGLGFELLGAGGLSAGGVEMVGVLLLESQHVPGALAIKTLEGIVLVGGERAEVLV